MILKYTRFLLLVSVLLVSGSAVFAQTTEPGRLPYDPYRLEKTEALTKMDKAIALTDAGKYTEANGYFLEAMDQLEVLPPELCYHFGRNSYYLKKYSQSLSWLYKYLELKGSQGRYSTEAGKFIEKAESGLRQEKEGLVKVSTLTEPSTEEYSVAAPCEKGQQVKCPVCHGEGVVITQGVFENTYRTCPYGDDGAMACETFMLFRDGRLTLPGN
ncbi:hypothetical protein AB9P05_13615 [Roseivirga sp. BDSF3-8]|uniref:hypothetical protein n=1 Tax=Roseivirga sp. BDSF3-8 TaxID=3241598 RepID=UPI003531E62F